MIIPMSIVFLIKFVFVDSEKIDSLNCFYMKYMNNIFYANFSMTRTPESFRSFADKFQSVYGEIILAILDELREKEPSNNVYELMNINLYLNNVFGTLMVRSYVLSNVPQYATDDQVYELEFSEVRKVVIADLREGIAKKCFSSPQIIPHIWLAEDYVTDQKYKDLNNLLPKEYPFNKNKHVPTEYMEGSALALKDILNPIIQRGTYWNLHPKKMLFYDMLSTNGPKSNNTSPGNSDPLDLLREVTLQTELTRIPVNIGNVFKIIQRYFSTICVRTFQQQVLAATVHPLLHLIGTYLMFFKRVYYLDMKQYGTIVARVNMFKPSIENMGALILNVFDKFISLELLPKKIQTYLTITQMELRSLVHCTDKLSLRVDKPTWIEFLYDRCSQPMKHNKLRFETDVESWQMDKNNTETIMNNIDRVEKYIDALSNQKIHYDIVVNKIIFFSHDDMFENVPECDILYCIKGVKRFDLGEQWK